jgi:ATP-binding cassette subfamily F protein uup
LDRELERLSAREQELHSAMAASATDHEQLAALSRELDALVAERDRTESSWLETAALLEE